jgi:L-ascorbate metabolism protein UlaG (beta-lactamase superfamily)
MDRLYLKDSVVAQPTILRWYACPELIAPQTAALNVVFRHLRTMRSYVKAPEMHAALSRRPETRGGPFMALDSDRQGDVRALIEETERRQAPLIELAEAIRSLERLLLTEARGRSLEPLYPRVPDVLRGFVELVYDLGHRPGFRFIEGLLYRSRYYDPGQQGFAVSDLRRDDRPFVLSTPLLPRAGQLDLELPFDSPCADALLRARTEATPVEELEERLQLPRSCRELFRSFFTEEAPRPRAGLSPGQARVRYFGHACLLIETESTRVLIDPIIAPALAADRFSYADLPPTLDAIVLTHAHADHTLLEALLSLRHRTRAIFVPRSSGGQLQDPSLKLTLDRLGFLGVRELSELESIDVDAGVRLTALPFLGEHADLDIRSKQIVLLSIEGRSLLVAADTRNVEPRLYERVHALVGDVDLLFLGMECDGAPLSWLYGPLFAEGVERGADQSRRLSGSDCEMAMDLVRRFRPRRAYVYAMGQEPWLMYLTGRAHAEGSMPMVESSRFLEECSKAGVAAERLFMRKDINL